jgi:hypothetical protein
LTLVALEIINSERIPKGNQKETMKASLLEIMEREELIQKIIERGHGELVNALLLNEGKTYTKRGRLNKSGACRILGWKTKQLEDALEECRQILSEELNLE